MHEGNYSAALDEVSAVLHQGQQPRRAHALAAAVLARAKAEGDLLTQARALYLLGRAEHLDANLNAGLSLARQAAHLFHVLDKPLEESTALSHVAHLASLLGLSEEAVENATLSVQLADTLPPGPHTVDAYNYLGVAATWVEADYADRILAKTIALAQRLLPPHAAARPMVNRLINELYRLELCLQRGQAPVVQPAMWAQLEDYRTLALQSHGAEASASDPCVPVMRSMLDIVHAGFLAHSGQRLVALDMALGVDTGPLPPWLHAFVCCIVARCQLAAGQWPAALTATQRTLDIARAQGQLNFELMSLYQRMEAFEALGDSAGVLAKFHAFRHCQLRQQTEIIISRERMASLRLAWREQTRALEALHTSTRVLERLTLEDPLTGLANRRHLERKLDELLTPHPDYPDHPATPWCLVMIDIDGFKQINDRYSHVLGDDVLRKMAQLLREVTRPQDLAVRLAGDEFVLILRDTTEPVGNLFVERLNRTIDQHPWSAIQPGLAVRASIGLAQAHGDDTSASLLRRSDLRMYANKTDKLARHLAQQAGAAPLDR
ncbi:GGDEF domain-containing protein [uncultured Sphaerotilus sp.]|uniref:GGDEF domain-containing protein n=1 Tax=uncultured Sphaerotilus sp. TaxID=474984 RepID=UPI0030CA5722